MKKTKSEAGAIGGSSKSQSATCLPDTAAAIAAQHGVHRATAIRAERRAGELLAGMEKHNGRPQKASHDVTVSLADLGVTRMQSHRWQTVARIPRCFACHAVQRRPSRQPSIVHGGVRRRCRPLTMPFTDARPPSAFASMAGGFIRPGAGVTTPGRGVLGDIQGHIRHAGKSDETPCFIGFPAVFRLFPQRPLTL